MTIQTQVFTFIPREYEIFAGLDVDKHSIAATFTDHSRLMQRCGYPIVRRSCLTMSASIFPGSGWPLFMKPGQRGLASTMIWWQTTILAW